MMSPPSTTRSAPSLQVSVAVLAEKILQLEERTSEDRATVAANLKADREAMADTFKADREFNEKTYVTKDAVRPIVALFWTVITAMLLGLGSWGWSLLSNHAK